MKTLPFRNLNLSVVKGHFRGYGMKSVIDRKMVPFGYRLSHDLRSLQLQTFSVLSDLSLSLKSHRLSFDRSRSNLVVVLQCFEKGRRPILVRRKYSRVHNSRLPLFRHLTKSLLLMSTIRSQFSFFSRDDIAYQFVRFLPVDRLVPRKFFYTGVGISTLVDLEKKN